MNGPLVLAPGGTYQPAYNERAQLATRLYIADVRADFRMNYTAYLYMIVNSIANTNQLFSSMLIILCTQYVVWL